MQIKQQKLVDPVLDKIQGKYHEPLKKRLPINKIFLNKSVINGSQNQFIIITRKCVIIKKSHNALVYAKHILMTKLTAENQNLLKNYQFHCEPLGI